MPSSLKEEKKFVFFHTVCVCVYVVNLENRNGNRKESDCKEVGGSSSREREGERSLVGIEHRSW